MLLHLSKGCDNVMVVLARRQTFQPLIHQPQLWNGAADNFYNICFTFFVYCNFLFTTSAEPKHLNF